MTPADDVIARAARAVTPYLAAQGIRWTLPGRGAEVPGEAELALKLRDMVARVEPGGRIEHGGLVVEWPKADVEIRILFDLAAIKPEERT
ncbi:hypothetical protein E1264_17925 [Actinomadura sp. KC216]|uniref:hypothetical protein n=1 Tax=Actinomadura sp. KC216 TaxID=2530370 RepID=UPI00104A3C95|nr:hypothetical protein [Actinomadura sp. KC216]TDB86476.1 hypothetical protein E1264_17925 [Actinomadura sp. KC216]